MQRMTVRIPAPATFGALSFAVLVAGSAFLALSPATPAAAQESAVRTRTLVIFGDDPCPTASNPDEIIVCARRPEEERYRIPKEIRDNIRAETTAREDEVAAERAALVSTRPGAAGTGSCSPVGGGGTIGCTPGINVIQAAKTVVDGVKTATEPDD